MHSLRGFKKIRVRLHQICSYRLGMCDFVFLLILTVGFFALPVFVAPDSDGYIYNAEVLASERPMSSWFTVRGPLLPLILRFSFAFFGESAYGTAVMLYIWYLALLVFTLYAFHLLGLMARLGKLWCWVLGSVLIFLNPTVLTYAHMVLTEFFALVLGMAALCLILKTQQLLLCDTIRRGPVYLVRYGGAVLLVVGLYALKQMFFILIVALFFISECIVVFARHAWKQVLASLLAFVLLVLSIPVWSFAWGSIVGTAGGQADTTYSAEGLAQSTLIDGLRYFRPEERGTVGKEIRIDIMSNGFTQVEDSLLIRLMAVFQVPCIIWPLALQRRQTGLLQVGCTAIWLLPMSGAWVTMETTGHIRRSAKQTPL